MALSTTPEHAKPLEDPMTGFPGFDGFGRDLETLLAEPPEAPTGLVLVDLDHFGAFNRAHGRTMGDRMILALAAHLASTMGEGARLYRYGGDAIAAILPRCDKEEAFLRVEKARATFNPVEQLDPEALKSESGAGEMTFCAAVAAIPEDADKSECLKRLLMAALYRAKVDGPNKVCLAREDKMVTKTAHYGQGQLIGLTRLAKRLECNEATLLREALDDLLRKYNA